MGKVYSTKKTALKELERRRKRKDFESNIYKLDDNIYFIGTRDQALREIRRRKI